jgi:hypothetical protein
VVTLVVRGDLAASKPILRSAPKGIFLTEDPKRVLARDKTSDIVYPRVPEKVAESVNYEV